MGWSVYRPAPCSAEHSKEEAWSRYNRGRINWAVWTGGNDRFWDAMASLSPGAVELLKTISSHPSITSSTTAPRTRSAATTAGSGSA